MDKLTQVSNQYPQPSGLAGAINRGEIPTKLEITETHIGILSQTLSQLEDKLYPVLTSVNEKESGSPTNPTADTPIGQQIDNYNDAILYQIRRINSLINRLHV